MDRTDPPRLELPPPDSPGPPVEPAGGLTSPGSTSTKNSGDSRPPARQETSPDSTRHAPAPLVRTSHGASYRLLITISVGFIIVFLFLRVFAVEPFGVPTGSMAPTLLGNHRMAPCPRCSYPIRVGSSGGGRMFAGTVCLNCGQSGISLINAREINGDRLLVDKNIYHLRRPRRWEIAVFRCAADLSKPYVKRVVGLPDEIITLAGGDVYADGELLRKTLAEVRETLVPVFDMTHSPNGGWGRRWLVSPPGNDPRLPAVNARPPEPADGSVVRGADLILDAAGTPETTIGLTYRNWNLDEHKEEPIRAWTSYDGPPRSFGGYPTAHDFVLVCEVEVAAVAGGAGTFACRLFDGADAVNAELSVGAKAAGRVFLSHEGKGGLSTSRGTNLEPGHRYKLEFAFVDRRVMLALDGKSVVPHADLPAAPKRGEVRQPLQLGARGCKVIVRNLKLYRDIHYTLGGPHGSRVPAKLGPTEYFMLGDNSGNSQDSREWPHPGVPEADFIGKPILVHQPLRLGRLTVAGQERVFQTLDWARLRWLH